jgi:hypothetical protein
MNIDKNEQLREQVAQMTKHISALEHEVLRAKDQIIGDHARNSELLHRLEIAEKANKELRKEIKAMRVSTTWKLGRVFMLPIRVLKLFIRLLK